MSRYEDLKDRARETIFDNVMGEIEAPKHQKMIHDILDRLEIDVDDLYYTSDSHTEDISQLKSDVEIKLYTEQYNSDKELQKEIDENQDKRIDDNRVKISEGNQEIKVIKDTLKHLNSNDEIQEVKGGSVISLPNNSMKSVVPNYRIEGLTVQNLVKNGDFKEGIKYWGQAKTENLLKEGGYTLGSNESIFQWAMKKDPKVHQYARFIMMSESDGVDVTVGFNQGPIYKKTLSKGLNLFSIRYGAGGENSSVVNIKNKSANSIILKSCWGLDLTQMFGAGNEPSKEWCDANLPDYVEGTKSVQLPMRVKSMGENLFNALGTIIKRGNFIPNRYGEELGHNKIKRWNNARTSDVYGYRLYLKKGEYVLKFKASYKGKFKGLHGFLRSENGFWLKSYSTPDVNFNIPYSGYYYLTFGCTTGDDDRTDGDRNENYVIFENIQFSEKNSSFKPYQESISYFNDKVELSSVATTKDYIENGKLYKNISDEGEILEETEVINLSTSGLIEANPNGTVFFEPITNLTGFYDNGLDVEGLDILEVEEFSHLVNGVYQSLDVSKVKVEGGKLTHPDAQNGLVYLVYRYDDNPVYGESAISYYNNNRVLESPNGTFFKPVFSVDDEGNITMKGEKL